MLTEADPLLRAVLADPPDDAPRLIYADYLDDAGRSEYAQYIRVQVELAARRVRRDYNTCKCVPGKPVCRDCRNRAKYDVEDSDLFTQQSRLQTQRNLASWFPAVDVLASSKPKSAGRPLGHIARGFVYDVTFDLVNLEHQMHVVFALHPVTRAHIFHLGPVSLPGTSDWCIPLASGAPEWLRVMSSIRFISMGAARDHLSAAIVYRGRELAGL